MAEKLTYGTVWDELSQVDCSEHTEKKGKLTYLSWAWAWGMMMEHYPNAQYSFQAFKDANEILQDTMFYPDGSASVHVTVNIDELTRSMWLSVMDYKNNAISNPNSRQISDSKMRCLVKCIAMFGLGHYVYAGEDLPPPSDDEKEPEQAEEETKVTEEELPVNYEKFSESLIETATKMEETVSGLESLWKSNKDTIKELKAKDEELYQKLVRSFAERRSQMENATEEVATEEGDKEDD
jgi:hypothetical protein